MRLFNKFYVLKMYGDTKKVKKGDEISLLFDDFYYFTSLKDAEMCIEEEFELDKSRNRIYCYDLYERKSKYSKYERLVKRYEPKNINDFIIKVDQRYNYEIIKM